MVESIDVAVNAFFPEWSSRYKHFGYWRFLGPRWQQRAGAGWSVEVLLKSMDEARVEMAGLVAFWAADSHGQDIFISAQELSGILKKHKRFFGLVGLNPILPRKSEYFATKYLEIAVRDLGFKAAHLALHWFGMRPDDKRLYPIYQKCLELDVPIVMPLGAAPPRCRARSVAEPVLLDPVIGDFPELRIVGQSIGYPWERESVYLARNNPNFNILADSPAPKHWVNDFTGFIKQGRFPKYDAGSDQVMWSSGFPFIDHAESRHQFDALGFSESIKSQMLRENAIRVFKLDQNN